MKTAIGILIALSLALTTGCGGDSEPQNEAGQAYADEVEVIVEGEINPAATSVLDALLNIQQGGRPDEADEIVEEATRELREAEAEFRALSPPEAAREANHDLTELTGEFADFLATPLATAAEARSFGRIEAVGAYERGIQALADAAQALGTSAEP